MNVVKKLYDSTKWSVAGLIYAYKHELAFRLELLLAVFLTPAAFYIALDLNQVLWLLCSLVLVLMIELLNTAIEATVDRIGHEKHQLSKHAKDAGSAAVFCALLIVGIVWGLIIWNNFVAIA